jgi:hypothetical protein
MTQHFPRPEEEHLSVEREPVDGVKCPECGSTNVERYPVLSEDGWVSALKCQDCLCSVEREERDALFGGWEPWTDLIYEN